jgi:predicted outer membrane protein
MTKTISRREAGALTLLTALTGGAAVAQPYSAQRYPAQPHAGMNHGAMALTAGDQRYVMDFMRIGGVGLRSSQLARSRSGSPLVRAFAEMEYREQVGLSTVLGDISGMRSPPPPTPRFAAAEAALARARGPEFDRLFGLGQIEAHEVALRIQDDYLRGGRNQHLRHVATLARGQILDHLTLLRDGPRLLGARL